MTFYVDNDSDLDLMFDTEELLKLLTETVLSEEKVPYRDVSVNLLLTGEEEIKETNSSFRGIDRVTDVLSFPAIDFETPGDLSGIEEGDPSYFDSETGELILGDIMICVKRAMEQAEEYGHSLRREIAFLITHSLFHLLGYDHETDEERTVMEEKQEAILSKVNILREN
ncbi:MAG: rRNA maturation RNase YbeY [Lachnospiraceae bacterium]|nr:rRNA maturation RNase YbeY [Lachnospiraceae bacterium]